MSPVQKSSDVPCQNLFGLVASGGAGCQHARGHPFDNITDEAAGHPATSGCGTGGCDGPARVVAEHDDERGVEHAHAVLDGTENTVDLPLERSRVLAKRVAAGRLGVVGLSYRLAHGSAQLVADRGLDAAVPAVS